MNKMYPKIFAIFCIHISTHCVVRRRRFEIWFSKFIFSRSEAGDPVRLVSWWFSRNIQANPIGVNVDAVRDIIKIFGRKPDNVMNGTLKDLVKIHSCFSTIEIWVSKNSINHFWITHPTSRYLVGCIIQKR